MKKIYKTLMAIVACAMVMVSCDKIEEDNYLIFSGAAGQWFDGEGVADHSQRAIIEKYTGVRCINCPDADQIITAAVAQYNGSLIAVSIHDSSVFTRPYGSDADLRCADGDIWSHYFGVFDAGQYPSAIINRTKVGSNWDLFTPTSGVNERVDNIINGDADVAVAVAAELQNDAIDITVNLEMLQQVNDELTLTLLLMEDGIVTIQANHEGKDSNYVQNHVLRDVITDVWGADVDCNGAAGQKRVARFSYTTFREDWNLEKSHIVAVIGKKGTREILNVAECEID